MNFIDDDYEKIDGRLPGAPCKASTPDAEQEEVELKRDEGLDELECFRVRLDLFRQGLRLVICMQAKFTTNPSCVKTYHLETFQ
jgi:hypothetical protein